MRLDRLVCGGVPGPSAPARLVAPGRYGMLGFLGLLGFSGQMGFYAQMGRSVRGAHLAPRTRTPPSRSRSSHRRAFSSARRRPA